MRRIAALIIPAVLLAFMQGCGFRQSIGYVNNDLAWRQASGEIKTEVSLGGNVVNQFNDKTIDVPGYYYYSDETGDINTNLSLGLAFYYRLFKNDIFDLSAGLKFTNYFNVDYNYLYYFDLLGPLKHYHYDETMQFDYLNSNRVSILFPDVEIKCPFSDNLKFVFSVELLYISWRYNNGYIKYTFSQDVSTSTRYTEGGNPGSVAAPGAINSVKGGSDIFSIGGVNLGLLYYF